MRIGIVTAPIDAGVANVGGRRGAAAGPRAILDVLQSRGLGEHCSVHPVTAANTPESLEADLERLTAVTHRVVASHDRVLVLGGDHGITYGAVAGLGRSRNIAALAYIDVHWDLRPYAPHTSGSSFRRILEAGLVHAARLHPVGIQRPTDPERLARSRFDELAEYATRAGVRATMFEDAKRLNLARTVASLLEDATGARYLSIDMDAVDEREAPGVSAPGPGRFALREVVRAASMAAPLVQVADLVETAPALDPSGRTVEATADVAQAILHSWMKSA